MEEAIGIVIKCDKKTASIKLDRKTMCGDNCSSCGNICGIKDTVIKAQNPLGAESGDMVKVTVPTNKGILAIAIAYGVPLVLIVITALLSLFAISEKIGAILIFAEIILWFGVLKIAENHGPFKKIFKTEITEILSRRNNNESE